MPQPENDIARREAAVWQAMVLFSTLSTAAEVWHSARERRAGRDPSEQEVASFVHPYLRRAAGELQALLMQLQAARVQAAQGDGEAHITRLVRRYNDLMTLRHVMQQLKVVHQRLLSLYPAVTEMLVEEARLLHEENRALLDVEDEAFPIRMEPFLQRALVFAGTLYDESR